MLPGALSVRPLVAKIAARSAALYCACSSGVPLPHTICWSSLPLQREMIGAAAAKEAASTCRSGKKQLRAQ